jgi:predicted RNase H-like nuclease (RuvC/YqgF family)
MKTEKAIQILRDYNLWRRGNEDMEQPDPREIGEAIDDVLMAIDNMEEEAKLHRGAITGWQNKWECAVELAAKAQADLDKEREEGEEQARLLGKGSEREVRLRAENRSLERALEKAEAERELWREEAKRWREQTMELDGQLEGEIQRLQWRQYQLDCGINELKSGY